MRWRQLKNDKSKIVRHGDGLLAHTHDSTRHQRTDTTFTTPPTHRPASFRRYPPMVHMCNATSTPPRKAKGILRACPRQQRHRCYDPPLLEKRKLEVLIFPCSVGWRLRCACSSWVGIDGSWQVDGWVASCTWCWFVGAVCCDVCAHANHHS